MCKSEPQSRFQAVEFIAPHMNARANPKPRLHAGKAAVLRVALQEDKSSARAEARARTNVGQSVGPQPYRVGPFATAREASVALPRGLRLELGMHSFGPSTATPNPSVEGMAKRLRLLCTPHVKRWASPLSSLINGEYFIQEPRRQALQPGSRDNGNCFS